MSLDDMSSYDRLYTTCTSSLPTEPLLRALALCSSNAANPCFGVNCGEHGSCAGGSCQCERGYSGGACEVVDPCEGSPCAALEPAGMECLPVIGGHNCSCPEAYTTVTPGPQPICELECCSSAVISCDSVSWHSGSCDISCACSCSCRYDYCGSCRGSNAGQCIADYCDANYPNWDQACDKSC